jgi:glycosyltransferase involved in cell wall biosynthesis
LVNFSEEMKDITFSLVIPTHNRAHLIKRALRSVEKQSLPAFEIVVIDDGSSDGTADVLASYRCDNLVVVRNARAGGVSAARNKGIGVARGEFVVFLDDDDELRPCALEELHAQVVAFPDVDFLWGARQIHVKDDKGREAAIRQDQFDHVHSRYLRGRDFLPFILHIATNSAFTVRRSVFSSVGGFDETLRVSEDRDLFLRLAIADLNGIAIAKTVIDINEHFADSLSRSVGLKRTPEMDLRVIEKQVNYLSQEPQKDFYDDYLRVVMVGFLRASERRKGLQVLRKLSQRRALTFSTLKTAIKNMPEYRAIKVLVRYDTIRGVLFRYRLRRKPSIK